MICVHAQYLEEKQTECLLVARSANDGTQAKEEWLRTAEAIMRRRKEHFKSCKECGEKK